MSHDVWRTTEEVKRVLYEAGVLDYHTICTVCDILRLDDQRQVRQSQPKGVRGRPYKPRKEES